MVLFSLEKEKDSGSSPVLENRQTSSWQTARFWVTHSRASIGVNDRRRKVKVTQQAIDRGVGT
jgi:hypothetical protein